MNFESAKALVTSKTARQVLLTRKHSPKILFVAGAVGVVGATVLACRATLKVGEVLDFHEKHLEYIRDEAGTEQITPEAATKLIHKAQINTALKIAKPYIPAAILLAGSIAALTGSHVILTKRNGVAMAAYAGLDKAYKQYRTNVVEKYGKDEDHKLAFGAENVNVEEKTADGKTKIKVESKITGNKIAAPYAALFDQKSHKWSKEPGRNALTLQMLQSYANQKLVANGYLFLNDVYASLGLPITAAGQQVGWIYDMDSDNPSGDNYVDFGVFSGDQERAEAFIDGEEPNVWLDPNVDGFILDKI